ncbi:MAG: hypothetical protein JXR59_02685, partial [Desulfuromonadaceae bacterium]|nr:hypothetical protein [Desulfuromonadaceae bacterium]
LSNDELKAARSNPQTTEVLQAHIDQQLSIAAHFEALAAQERNGQVEANEEGESGTESLAEEDFADHEEEYDELRTASKQQIAMELSVSEKVKMAMTGDKEWRSIMLKDSNKQISSAVLANPRISEGEVLQLAQNRSTSEELIRLILLNREWLKNYPIRLALTQHPRTPISQAMRFLSTLSEKDLRILSKSRNISSVIVNNCRRMLAAKTKH